MLFKDLLTEVGNSANVPLNLINFLPNLLSLDQKEIDSSLAYILSEVLIPKSQNFPANIAASTLANSLPESTAKGSQLQAIFKDIDANANFSINWYLVFSKIQENLFDSAQRDIQPSVSSINQFITSIDFKPGLLDIALNYDWYFSKTLLFAIHSLDPKQGSYDITLSPFLTRCFGAGEETPIEAQLGKKNVVSFINVGKLELTVMNSVHNSPQLRDQRSMESQIVKLFEHHRHTFPEYMLLAAVTIVSSSPASDSLQFVKSILDNLFETLLTNNGKLLNSVFESFLDLDSNMFFQKCFDYYQSKKSTDALLKIAAPALDLKYFDKLFAYFSRIQLVFGVNLVIASTVAGVDCESVFGSYPDKHTLAQAVLEVMENKSTEDSNSTPDKSKVLGVATAHYLLTLLNKHAASLDGARYKDLQLQLLTTYPRLINFGCGHDAPILMNDASSNMFTESIEQEMKGYYSKMYNKELEIEEIVSMLVNFKSSDVPHDQDVFACMIHSLLDEYRFFSEYPLTALASTSLLFGALLARKIIEGTTLTVALNFIVDSCNQPSESHLFKFAVQALYNFKSRLPEYPNYCKRLLESNSLSTHSKMFQIVKEALSGKSSVDGPGRPDSVNSARNVDEASGIRYQSITVSEHVIGTAQQERPNESISDKILFFVNNLTGDNLEAKFGDVKDILTENYYLWFADYLVGDRAKSEPNNHKLYSALVKRFDDPILHEYILSVSLREVNHLVKNFGDSLTERNNLKNLGAWLGQITLASDKPLKRSHISLKFLLVEAYDFKTLPFIIPFVCKILDQAQSSKIFNVPNPWLLGIFKVLVELYDCADLKLNSKFEVEVLLNSFHMKVSDIEPSTIIRSHNPNPTALAILFGAQPNPESASVYPPNGLSGDFNKLALDVSQQQQQQQQPQQMPHAQFQSAQIPQAPGLQQQMVQHQQQQGAVMARGTDDQQLSSGFPGGPIGQLPTSQPPGNFDTSFNSLVGNSAYTTDPNLRRAFQASLSRAVRECLVPIASKAADSVLTTTEALVRKDFAYEGDVSKFRKAYQTLAVRLAQSVINSSGRKLLIETIEAFMIQLLTHQYNPSDINLPELASAIQSNVDLCVDMVNRFAMNSIIDAIEQRMKFSVFEREKLQPGQQYVEPGADNYALNLPLPLGLKQDGLTPGQLSVYDNFGGNVSRPEAAPLAPISAPVPQQSVEFVALNQQQVPIPQQAIAPGPPAGVPAAATSAIGAVAGQTPQITPAGLPRDESAAVVDQMFNVIVQSCDRAVQSLGEVTETSLADIPQEHIIMQCINNVLGLSQTNALRYPELLLKVAQYAVNCLFTQTHENPISNEIFVVILDKLCEYSPSTAKDVTWWLVHSSDQRKLNIPVMHSLLKVQLVQPSKLDSSISGLINETGNPSVVKFASTLLYNIFSEQDLKPIAQRSEFGNTLRALEAFDSADEEAKDALESRNKLFNLLGASDHAAHDNMYTQLGYVLTEWYRLLSHGECSDELKSAFIKGLYKHEILTDSELFGTFFKSGIEIAITAFATEHDIRSRTQHENILLVDALASLIVEIIIRFDKTSVNEAMTYFKTIIGVILVSFMNDHEAPNNQWNERAYFRFFSSLLNYWNDASLFDENKTAAFDSQFYNVIGETFNAIQPIVFPGFTFAWISLISHRMFLARLLELPQKQGYDTLVKILTRLLKFETIYSSEESTDDVVNVIFKAINRIFVGLYHDCPEFLAENYISLLSALPRHYIQLRNIVLSATPKNIRLENPFTPGLKVERISELKYTPDINYQPVDDLVKYGLKKAVDGYLRIPAPGLVKSIYNGFKLTKSKKIKGFGYDSVSYNIDLMNSLVLYVTLSETQDLGPSTTYTFNSKGPHVQLFYDLLNHGSTEFKYHLINALANQLRYPNKHTHLSVGIFLHFFNYKTNWVNNETKSTIQEIITRVLLERHAANKPHQWGLTILFTELVKNDTYSFFELPFVKNAAPEIKIVFDALLNNINGS